MVNNSQPITVPDFNGGISKRADRYRSMNQMEDLKNCDINLEDGLFKRNPAVYVSALDLDVSANNAFVHTFVRSEDETYSIVFDGSSVSAFDQDGVSRTIYVDPLVDTSYVSSSGGNLQPREAFRAITLGDNVLFCRKDVVVKRDDTALSRGADAHIAYVFVREVQYGVSIYSIYSTDKNGTIRLSRVHTAKDFDSGTLNYIAGGGNYPTRLRATTSNVAKWLKQVINFEGVTTNNGLVYDQWADAGSPGPGDLSATLVEDNVIKFFDTEGDSFRNVNTADDLGDRGLTTVWKSVEELGDLPPAIDEAGFKVKIEGNRSNFADDYYVKWIPAGYDWSADLDVGTDATDDTYETSAAGANSNANGAWRETVGFEQTYKYDYDTCPLILAFRPDGSFLLTRLDGRGLGKENAFGGAAENALGLKAFEYDGVNATNASAIHLNDVGGLLVGDAIKLRNIYPDTEFEAPLHYPFPDEIVENRVYWIKEIDATDETIYISDNPDLTGIVTYTPIDTAGGSPYDSAYIYLDHIEYSNLKLQDRDAGDDFTNPWPSFIDNTINDMVLHRNRLAFISRDAVTLSEFGEFFNFFRTTVQELLDTAPIEVQTTDNTTRELLHAISYKNQLVVFSKEAQFILQGEPGLTPASVSFNLATAYDSNRTTRPFTMGDRLYFIETRNGKNRLQEMTEVQFRGNFIAQDLGTQIPNEITGDVRIVATNGVDKIFLVSENDLKTVYVLTLRIVGNSRPLTAWHRFVFDDIEIENLSVIDNDLVIVGEFENKHRMLYKMSLDTDFTKPFLDNVFDTSLVPTSPTYDSVTDKTTYTFPFSYVKTDWKAVNKSTFAEYNIDSTTDTTIVLDGDTSAEDIYFGKPYESLVTFSKFYPQSRGGKGSVVNDQVVIDTFGVSFDQNNIQAFDISSVNINGPDYVKTYTTNIMNVNNIGEIKNAQDYEEVLVQARNRDVTLSVSNDTFIPFNLINFEYRVSEGRKRH